eukprot:3206204-Pleurochrysis_carterae.AAC.2
MASLWDEGRGLVERREFEYGRMLTGGLSGRGRLAARMFVSAVSLMGAAMEGRVKETLYEAFSVLMQRLSAC